MLEVSPSDKESNLSAHLAHPDNQQILSEDSQKGYAQVANKGTITSNKIINNKNTLSYNTAVIREKATLKDSLLPLTPPNNTKKYKIKCLDCKVCKKDGFIKLTYYITVINTVNIVKTFVENYRIWQAEVLSCVDRKHGLLSFKVLVSKAKINKVVS